MDDHVTAAQQGWGQRWPAPAKINLMLRIVGRKEDGYHLLQTVFQILDWCDWLTFYPLDTDKIGLKATLPGVVEENDLTVRAAQLLKQESGYQGPGVMIDVEKNLPMGGGLGGGSSDAATTLVVLNKLWNLHLPDEKLLQIGLKLGADVPVFVYGYSSWGEGVGECLKKISLPEQWFVIIRPDAHIETGKIFNHPNLTRNSKPITIADFLAGSQENDCLPVVRELYQSVDHALAALSVFGKAKLTGTGSCVFVQFTSESEARKVCSELSGKWQVFLAKGLNQSPLYLKA